MRDVVRMSVGHLGKAVDPFGLRAMGRTRVDHAYRRVPDEADRFARGRVGQAQDGDIARVECIGAARGVLAFGGGKREQPYVGAVAQTRVNLQPGRALVAVDEDSGEAHDGRVRRVRSSGETVSSTERLE
jgi:hypothetical protein